MSAADESMALSTRVAIAAALSAGSAYVHGLVGAILAEKHVEHLGSWAGGVSIWFVMGAVWLGFVAAQLWKHGA